MNLSRAPLQPEAIRCYRFLCELSLLFEVISEDTYDERLAYLDELLADPMDQEGAVGAADAVEPAPGRADGASGPYHDDDGLMHLVPDGPLRGWVFHEGDPDGLPSVPHGHEDPKSPPFPKLDPYLGWIHISTMKTSGRLKKALTYTLWNDPKFRAFARGALTHFAQENPRHHWRVDPERIFVLPRRRR